MTRPSAVPLLPLARACRTTLDRSASTASVRHVSVLQELFFACKNISSHMQIIALCVTLCIDSRSYS